MNFILKDIAPAGRMMDHLMKKTIIGIVGSSSFVSASSLWRFKVIAFVEQVEDFHDMLIFEGVLSLILRSFVGAILL